MFRLNFKLFNFLISFYLVFTNFVVTTHNHSDGEIHPDCQVCVFQLNQQSEDPSDLGFYYEIKSEQVSYISVLESKLISKDFPINALPRSPPALV
ncbi:MAG: hypothetical protein N2Z81_06255 [Hydrogenothermaceae bacterium]|nr:hypothetical protein [Hydrogenothermaceae bacterium]